MAGSEYFTEAYVRKRVLCDAEDVRCGSGPILFAENGRLYVDDSEDHVEVVGSTGYGKSQCVSLPFIREIVRKKENGIVVDPKEECARQTEAYIPEDYQVFKIDFRSPYTSKTCWNPLYYPYLLYQTGDSEDRDTASLMISELWSGIYPLVDKDPFWPQSAAGTMKGLTYALFDHGQEDEIHMQSLAAMMEQLEEKIGTLQLYKKLYEKMESGSMAKRFFSAYATAPNDTRASIHSVADNGMEVFARSRGLLSMLSKDTLFTELDPSRPFVIYIILPDETDIYHGLAGVLVSQLTRHLIRLAQKNGGALEKRVNLILEELGSIGRSIPELPNLMTAGRSRNLRMMLILQDGSQLEDVYGPVRAKAIDACVGILIGFSTNSWATLEEWSKRCGNRMAGIHDERIEPLITPVQLAAMPRGTALIMINRRYKFITRLPMYYELYGSTLREPNTQLTWNDCSDLACFDLRKYIAKCIVPERREPPRPADWMEPEEFIHRPSEPTYEIYLAPQTKVTKELIRFISEEAGEPPVLTELRLKSLHSPVLSNLSFERARQIRRRLFEMGVRARIEEDD